MADDKTAELKEIIYAKLPFRRAKDFPTYYANQLKVSMTPIDTRIVFCRVEINSSQEDSLVVERLEVFMPTHTAGELAKLISMKMKETHDRMVKDRAGSPPSDPKLPDPPEPSEQGETKKPPE